MEASDVPTEIHKEGQLEPILEDAQLTLAKAKPANNILHRHNNAINEEETTLGFHLNNSQLLNSHKTLKGGDRYNSGAKSSSLMEHLDDSFGNDTLSSVSKPGSILLGSGRLGDCLSISDRISCERGLYDHHNPSASKLSSRSNIELEVKALSHDQLRRYKKVFYMFKLSAEDKERLQKLFHDFFELEKQKVFINMIYDLKKIATYMTVKRKHSSSKSYNNTKTSIPSVLSERSDSENDKRYNCYTLVKKAFKALKTRTYYKSLNTKAEKFLYYKLLLKYMFQWIEYVRTKAHTLRQPDFDQSKMSSRRTYEDPFISPFQSKRSYRCPSMLNETIEEEKHPFTKYYEDNLMLKSVIALKAYGNGQKKKKNLEEILLDSLEAKYVFKPFRGWLYQTKYIKLRRKAALKIQRILYFATLRTVFNKIKKTEKPKHARRVSGVILNQSHILKRDQSREYSRGASQGARRRDDKENSFSYNDKSSFINNKSDFHQQFKTCLAGIFPEQKKNSRVLEQQNPNRSNIHQPTDYSANSQSFYILPKSLLVQTHTEDTGISLTLDTSHFATNENAPEPEDSKIKYKPNPDTASYLQPSKALMDHSLFRLNASKIEKPSKKQLNQSYNAGNDRESSFLQRSIQAKYFMGSSKGQEVLGKGRKQSPSPIPHKDNSSFSILDTSIQPIDQKENKPTTKPVPVKPIHDLQAKKVSPKPLSKQRSTSTNTYANAKARVSVTKNEKERESRIVQEKENPKVQRNKFKNMVDDLEEHLKYLNRNLLNQQLINKKLHSMKDQFISET